MISNNKYKILVVEDDEYTRLSLSQLFTGEGYSVICAESCKEAKTLYYSYVPDLVILNLGLPDKDGSTLLAVIRKDDPTPVIVLSARADETEKVRLLDMGANDYVTKPYGSAELLARVRAALRNNRHIRSEGRLPGGKFTVSDFTVDYDTRRVFVGGEQIKLTQTEYNILSLLCEHCGKMLSYSEIIKSIWLEFPNKGNIKKLQVNIANIRKKMGEKSGQTNYVVNVQGVGYRIRENDDLL